MKLSLPKLANLFNKKTDQGGHIGLALTSANAYFVVIEEYGNAPTISETIALDSSTDIAEQLKAWFAELSFDIKAISICLPFNQYSLQAVDKPEVDAEDLASALRYSAKDYVPGNLEDFVIEYFDIPAQPFGQNKVNMVAAKRDYLTSVIHRCLKQKLEIGQIGIGELALASFFNDAEEAVLLLSHLPDEELLVQIIKQGVVYFYRRVRSFNQLHTYAELEISNGAADNLSLEIQRSLDYFESQLRQAPVRRIYLAVPNKNEALLIDKIGINFSMPVLPLKNYIADLLPEGEVDYGFFNAIGAVNAALGESEVEA